MAHFSEKFTQVCMEKCYDYDDDCTLIDIYDNDDDDDCMFIKKMMIECSFR